MYQDQDVTDLYRLTIACKTCGDTKTPIGADWFCFDCQEYLCLSCYLNHPSLPRHIDHHTDLVDKDSEDVEMQELQCRTDLSKHCYIHTYLVLSHLCLTHSQTGCLICMKIWHKFCDKISLVDGDDGSCSNGHYPLQSAFFRKSYNSFSDCDLHHQPHSCLDDIDRDILEIVTLFEELKKVFCQENTSIDSRIFKSNQLDDKAIEEDMMKIGDYLSQLQEILQASEQNTPSEDYIYFRKDRKSSFDTPSGDKVNDTSKMEGRDAMFMLSKSLFIQSSEDTGKASITGLAYLKNGMLAVVDSGNRCLKLLDQNLKVGTRVALPSRPWDVTQVGSRNRLAITLPDTQRILLLSLASDIEPDSHILCMAKCYGICYYEGSFVVSFFSPVPFGSCIQILDISGNILKTIVKDSFGKQIVKWPQYLAISADQSEIYISDSFVNALVCVSRNGKVIKHYKLYSGCYPKGLCLSQNGRLYVGSNGPVSMFSMTDSGEMTPLLIDNPEMMYKVQCVTFNDLNGQMYIGCRDGTLWIYKLVMCYEDCEFV